MRSKATKAGRTTAQPGRRTQRERRETTRAKLLEATVATLIEQGYARLTTTDICRRAGLSQGALFKHFDTKAALLVAAVEHLFERNLASFRELSRDVRESDDRMRAIFDALWRVYTGPYAQVTLELLSVARSDAELAQPMAPLLVQHRAILIQQARELFPEVAALPTFDAHVHLILCAMQGAALEQGVSPDDPQNLATLDYLREISQAFALGASLVIPDAGADARKAEPV